MKFSVVTISFNQVRYLPRALDSVLGQEGVEVEYIVVDPGSTDGSLDVLAAYKPHLTQTIIGQDSGPANALNLGLEASSGEVFYYLNADDVVLPGAFRYVADLFSSNPKIDILCGSGWVVDAEGKPLRPFTAERFTPRRYVYGAAVALQQSTFFRRSAIGGVRFNEQNSASWDGEFLLDLVLAGKRLHTSPVSLSHFRWYDESLSGSGALRDTLDRELRRLFAKVTGRPRRRIDRPISLAMRACKKFSPREIPRPLSPHTAS